MTLLATTTANAMIKATGGEVVTQGSDAGYGHFERVPITEAEGAGGYAGGILTTQPSVIIADGIFSNLGPRTGIGLNVVVAGVTWQIDDIVPEDADGGTFRLMLKVPD